MAARAKTIEPTPEPEKPKLRKCCGTCAGWTPLNATPFWGECQPSRPGSNGPRPTTDLTSCSAHSWKPGLIH